MPQSIFHSPFSIFHSWGDGTGDFDGEGLTDWQEVIQCHTDPREVDTDGDGVDDGLEVQNGTKPLNPDTDNDGIPDGQAVPAWASSPLWASATNSNFTIRMADADSSSRSIIRVGGLAFFLSGTNTASLHLSPGVLYEISYATADGRAHGLMATFGDLPGDGEGLRGASPVQYAWHVDDANGILSGNRGRRGGALVAIASLSVIPETSTCVHDGDGCVFRVEMSPDDWDSAKAFADLDNLILMDDGRLFLPVPGIPGAYSDGYVTLGYPYLRKGTIGHSVSAHRCEGWSGLLCPICGTYHDSVNSCDHDPQCAAGHSPPEECDCDPIQVPLNCDDDDGNGHEDRNQQSLPVGEDDCVSFSPMRADYAYCCCDRVSFAVRVNSVSSNLRLWEDGLRLQAGSISDASGWTVEGIATNTSGQTSSISYTVLDGDENEVATITRKFVVSPSISFSFDVDSVLPGGKVVVVKRSTDPVRINNSTATVHASGLANGTYRLVADGARFHQNNQAISTVELDGGIGDADMYGDLPSSTMDDATLSLKTVGGTTLCTTNFTVLWVEISMRCGQDEPLSSDNVPGIVTNYLRLGKQKLAGLHVLVTNVPNTTASIGNVVELKGTVYPSDFIGDIGMARDCISEAQYYCITNGICVYSSTATNQARGQEGVGNDPTNFYFQDRDPRPCGHVYDIDTPGFKQRDLRVRPMGIIFNTTYNFFQYAYFKGRRCSDDFPWFSKTSVTKEDQDGYIELVFCVDPNDFSINSCGGGHVPIQ